MGMFSTRKPRRFRKVSIYTDESHDRLQELVDRVKREQGEAPVSDKPYNPDKFRGTFINYTPRVQRHKEGGTKMGWPLALLLIFVLIVVWRFLLTGVR